MKTVILKSFVALLAMLSLVAFSACSTDSADDDEVKKDTNFMMNTKWYTRDSLYDAMFGTKDGPNYIILDFSSETQVEYYVVQNNQIKSVFSTLTYKCKEDNIVEITSDGGGTAIFSVTGKQMKKINDEGLRYTSFTVWLD